MVSSVSVDTYKMHRIIIYSVVLFFEFFGLFGNVNLVFVILRNKLLKSKFGLIMVSLAIFHTVCLIFELFNMTFGVLATFHSYTIHRSICFHTTFPVILAHCLQTGTICILSFDLLLAIIVPFRYRSFHISWYFPCLYFLPVCYAIGTTTAAKWFLDDAVIPMCNPPSSMIPVVRGWWYQLMLIFSFFTLIFYLGAMCLLSLKIRRKSSDIRLIEKRAMRTLQVLIVTFLLTRFISTGIGAMVTIFQVDPEYAALVHNYNVIPAVAAYSQNAYVCFFRSEDYRRLLTQQMSLYLPFMGNNSIVKMVEHSTSRKRIVNTTRY